MQTITLEFGHVIGTPFFGTTFFGTAFFGTTFFFAGTTFVWLGGGRFAAGLFLEVDFFAVIRKAFSFSPELFFTVLCDDIITSSAISFGGVCWFGNKNKKG